MSKEMKRFGKWASLCLLFIFTCVLIPLTAEAVTFSQAQEAGKRLSAGLNHSLVLKSDGTNVAWGDNTYGQLNIPVGLSDVIAVSAGYYHNLALKADGSVVAWGRDNHGQSTVPVEAQSGVIAIAAGGYHSLALKEDGTVVAWGNDENGQITVSEGLSGVIAIAAGGTHSLALKEDGTVVAWGNNDRKQCNVPTGLTDVIAISAGNAHSLALKADGTVEAWGANTMWQCEVPEGLSNIVAISAGYDFSVALSSATDSVVTWGNITAPSSNINIGAISAGGSHALAVQWSRNVKISAWGNNDFEQCNVPADAKMIGNIVNIIVSEGEISFNPDKELAHFAVYVDNSVDSIDVTVIAENDNQAFTDGFKSGIPKSYSLNVGLNRIEFSVYLPTIGPDIYVVYRVNVYRAAADVDLKTLKTSVGTRTTAFVSTNTEYTINVDEDVANMDITAIPNNPDATVTIGENAAGIGTQTATVPLTFGENPVDIIVEKDGEIKTYSLHIIKAGFLENLTVSEGQLSSAFDPETFNYTVDVNSTINSLELIPTLRDSAHELLIDGQPHENGMVKEIILPEGNHHTIQLKVKLPSTEITRTYTININRVTKDDFIGSGTIEDPYLIYNLLALQEIAYDSTLLDKHFQLACDIDATNTVNWNNGVGFIPIGSPTKKFTGYFDGAGHTISGLSINQPERDNVGLFGYTEGGEIKNLGLVDCAISGGNNVGSLVGHNQNTYLENCFSTGAISGASVVGGLVGYGSGAYAGGRYYLDNCYSRASVQGELVTGGLIGKLGSGWLKNCYASGSVQGIENTGGMVGSLATANCQQTNCYWDIEASGQATSALGMGKTTAQMQEEVTYNNWDFDTTWVIDIETNEGYPYLRVFKDAFLSPVVDSSLILWLDGRYGSNDARTSIWKDLSGKGNNGELQNIDFTENSGWTGDYLCLDGVDDWINLPEINYDQDFTINTLFSFNNYADWSDLVTDDFFRIFYRGDSTGRLRILLRMKDRTSGTHSSWWGWTGISSYVPLETIVNLTYIKEGNFVSVYRDGVLVGRVDAVSGLNNGNDYILSPEIKSLLRIYGNRMSSNLYNLSFYDRALDADEVAQNYQAELPRIKAMTAANLAELTITPGALSPVFKASNLNYTVILEDRAVNSVNITATPAADDAMVTIDGLGIGTGTQSINVDVSLGTKEVPVVVTEADGITTKTYKIRIIKVGYLTDLALNGASLPGFAPETLDYTVNVANATNAVDIAAILEDPTTQDLMINNQPYASGNSMHIPLNEGQNTISIKVTVPGYETIYTLNIYRASLVDLKALTTNLGTLKPEFVPGTSVYTITLDDTQALNEIEITATPFEDNATVTIGATSGSGVQTGTVALNPGTNAINIVVANGALEKTYTVNVIRPAYLTALTVKNNVGQSLALTPGFASTTYDYTLANVANSVEFLDITAVGEGAVEIKSNGVLCDASHVPLNVWENTITIEVIVSSATRTYKLAVYREPSKNANLANLTTSSGTWDPVFDPATTIYAVTLDEKIDSLTLTATTEHPQATVKINGVATENANIPLTPGINTATVTVTAEDGITTKNYTVDIRRPAYLEALTVKNSAGQTIALTPDFTSTTFNYTVDTVPNNVIALAITATGEETAILEINGDIVTGGTEKNIDLDVGSNTITIKAIEPETEITKTYTLKAYRAANVNLSNLSTNTGKWNEEFTSGTTSYTVTLEKGDSNITITAVPADDQASVKIGGQGTGVGTQTISVSLNVGINSIPIEITGRDGATTKTYTLNVIRPVTLSGLTISNGTLSPAFDKDTLNYTAKVDDRTTSLEVTASAAAGAEIYINSESGKVKTVPLDIGTNIITIEVKLSGTSSTYKLTVTRGASNVNLNELKIKYKGEDIGTWDKTFTRETTSYTVTLDKAVEAIDVTVTPADSEATVSVLQPVIDNSLVLWLDGKQESNGSTAVTWNDLSGKGNHGQLNNFAYTTGSGWTGEGLEFDGVNDYVEFGDVLKLGSNNATWSFWAYPKDVSASGHVFSKSFASGETGRYFFSFINNKARMGVAWEVGHVDYYSNSNVSANTWTHVAVTLDRQSNLSIYLNGVLDVVFDVSVYSEVDMTTSNPFRIGSYTDRDKISPSSFFNGSINNFCMYNRALTPEEVLQNYRAGQEPAGARTVSVPLKSGQNSIPITVRGVDGVTTKTYTLNVIRPGALETLEIGNGTIDPEFTKDVNAYTVDSNVFLVKVTPTLEDLATQELYLNINNSETDTKCVSGETQVLELNKGINTVAIKVKTPSNNLVNTYTLNVNVVPLVEEIGMGDIDGTGLREVQSVFGAQVLSRLNFNLSQRVNTGLKVKFNLPEALGIQQVIGLYNATTGDVVTTNIEISKDVPEGVVAGNNVITINSSLDPGAYEVKFILTNDPIKLKVELDSFSEVGGNTFECTSEPLEIEYVDFPELL